MNYELQFDQNTIEFLQKLPKELRNRIFNKITSTKENPFRYFERLEGREEYKMRVGDYRIIADIENNKIKIVLIGHRKNIYKMLP
jgi:mRNA interferase RelE/StbE